jgi:hypothetical protein
VGPHARATQWKAHMSARLYTEKAHICAREKEIKARFRGAPVG